MANTISVEFAMMGHESSFQPKLFYHWFNLEQRVPQNHILRKIEKRIDLAFVYAEVKDSYGNNGNVSVPPPVILKMMLLLILYNVRSERELMNTIPLRLDWFFRPSGYGRQSSHCHFRRPQPQFCCNPT